MKNKFYSNFGMFQKFLVQKALYILAIIVVFALVRCSKSDNPTQREGKIEFNFTQYNQNLPLKYDTMIYTNEAENQYQVSEIQYFISDVKFYRSDGTFQLISQDEDIHYVDTDIPETQLWQVTDPVKAGNYDKISFIFGISEEKNQSNMFVNPPERDMFWPEALGGGYHYMKLNGKWLAANDEIKPFNFHLGIGQTYAGGVINVDSITGFVQNYFEVDLPNSGFSIKNGDTLRFEIRMNVENWFRNPHIYDHNYWGGMIMQNEEAMKTACENGKEDVFSFQELLNINEQ